MKVILVDDHTIFRQGLRLMLANQEHYQVIGEASNGQEAIDLSLRLQPELIIMDINMPTLNGLDATQEIKRKLPQVKVVVLSMCEEFTIVQKAIQSGVSAYVTKSVGYEELEIGLSAAEKGGFFLSSGISTDSMLTNSRKEMHLLTTREQEIMELVGGYTRQQIADMLCVSPKTVDRHIENIKDKLQVDDKEQIAKIAQSIFNNKFL